MQRASFVSPVAPAISEMRPWRRGRQVAIRVQDEAVCIENPIRVDEVKESRKLAG
jgi:hypothetical protein